MSVVTSAHGLVVQYGARIIFQNISFAIQDGERVAVVGANGSGKSTLLKIMAGKMSPDDGQCVQRSALRVAYVGQEDTFSSLEQSVENYLQDELRDIYSDELERDRQIGTWLGRIGLNRKDELLGSLSGGERKKLCLAKALAMCPDFLILDEPTNHLDIESILELEQTLLSQNCAIVFVSHDRWFIERLSTRVVEIGGFYPNGLLEVAGSYSQFLLEKDRFLVQLHKQQEVLANQVRREVEWLRRGPQGRATKSKSRKDRANDMVAQLENSKTQLATKKVEFDFATPLGKQRLISARNLRMEYDGRVFFDHLDLDLFRGQCLAVIGPNGCGKSTLLRVLCGHLSPVEGGVKLGEGVNVRYFDQNKEQLVLSKTVQETLAGDGEFVQVQGRSVHVVAYARRFLFRPEQMHLPVENLSGGERVRLILARFMTEAAELLILDEPTNDLDLESVQALELALCDFPGGIVLVSHDRFFLESVAEKYLALEEGGGTTYYASLDQWLNSLKQKKGQNKQKARKEKTKPPKENRGRRLSYMEKREWDQMEKLISEAEEVLEHWRAEVDNPKILIDSIRLKHAFEEMGHAQGLVDRLYERWAELERIQGGSD